MSHQIVGIQPEELQRLAAGNALSSLLQIALSRDLFAKLQGRQVSLDDLGETWNLPGPSSRFIAQALANSGLLTFSEGRVSNGTLAEAYLSQDSSLRRALMLPLRQSFSPDQLLAYLDDPPPSQWYQRRDDGKIHDARALVWQEPENFITKLAEQRHEMRIDRGKALAAVYDFSEHRKLLDLGGSSGGYCHGIHTVYPHLEFVVFDLPEATQVAIRYAEEADLTDQIEVVSGSIFTDELPRGVDAVLTANMLNMWVRKDVVDILRKVYDSLETGGVMLSREHFLEDDWQGPIEAIFEGFMLLGKEEKSGWQPSYREMEECFEQAGFRDVTRRPNLVLGYK